MCIAYQGSTYSGTGEYGDVGGHHVHAKAAFKENVIMTLIKDFLLAKNLWKIMD